MGRLTRQTNTENEEVSMKKGRAAKDDQNGEPSNDVNKQRKTTKRKIGSAPGKKTPVKKPCGDTSKNTVTAAYQEDQDVVTLQVEQDNEFKEGEIGLKTPPPAGSANCNASAKISENINEIDFINNAKELEETRNKSDEEELKIVSKRIAGETFALVKEMMEESELLSTASMVKDVKDHLSKSGEQGPRRTGEHPLTSTSETTIYE